MNEQSTVIGKSDRIGFRGLGSSFSHPQSPFQGSKLSLYFLLQALHGTAQAKPRLHHKIRQNRVLKLGALLQQTLDDGFVDIPHRCPAMIRYAFTKKLWSGHFCFTQINKQETFDLCTVHFRLLVIEHREQ